MDYRDNLDDIWHESKPKKLVPANKGLRLANYLIDTLAATLVVVFFAVFLAMLSPRSLENASEGLGLLFQLMSIVIAWLYYTLIETSTQGKSIGKYITGTRVVTAEGAVPSPETIAVRSLCRYIPFEAFSFLGASDLGWHDRLSKTLVIDERQSEW